MFAYCGNNPVNRVDSTGREWFTIMLVVAVVAVFAVTLLGCSSQSVAPPDYVQEDSPYENCYSYAFDLPYADNPGCFSITEESDYMFNDKKMYTPKEITGFVVRDMAALNKSVRVVGSPEDKKDNEYIVAMKTSTTIHPKSGTADYHFAVLLSDGTWADKPGGKPSRWNKLDGTALYWDEGNYKDYYNTASVYFAVER